MGLQLEQFGFRALWSPYFLIFTLVLIFLFFYVAIKKRHWFEGAEPLKVREGVLVTISLLLIYVTKGSPIDLIAHLMFTFHMIQMAFLFLLVPQLLIRGIPIWMWKKLLSIPIIKQIYRFFTKPLLALVLFNMIFSFYHIPFIFDLAKTNIWYHGIYTLLLLQFAIFMWWPLLNKIEGQHQLSGLMKLGYLLAAGVLLTPACALIIFNKEPMYSTYTSPEMWVQALSLCVPASMLNTMDFIRPEMFNPLPLNYDQQLGGVIMKVLQEIFYGAVLYKIFIDWYRKEQNEPDPILNLDPELLNKSMNQLK